MNRLLDSLTLPGPASLTSDPALLNRERLRAQRRGICGRAFPPQLKSPTSWRRLRLARRLSVARELVSSSHRLDAGPTSLVASIGIQLSSRRAVVAGLAGPAHSRLSDGLGTGYPRPSRHLQNA